MATTASQILGWLKKSFDEADWSYEEFADRDSLKSTNYPLDCKLKNFDIIVNCRDDSFTFNANIRIKADEDCRLKVAEYITRANWGLRYGCFELDFRDGEIRYRHTEDCTNWTSIPEHAFMRSVYLPKTMFERYGDGLLAVMYGFKSPEDAIKDAEGE